MRSASLLSKLVVLPVFLLVSGIFASAQTESSQQDLYKEIARMDSVLFNAFNVRDTATFKALFSPDMEFYHDKGGLTGYAHTIEFMRTTARGNNQLRRELVKESLEVYPIPGYGAMEIGSHRFCHIENGKQDCGTFKFVHVWQKKDGAWKITRIISYGH